ncbi:Uncharacterized protein APZ42_006017 [Daphnia magna]|uniref:Uncharacterized protein n=1 Tax=Daphnia magna TaxID=35525 RepID=A0A164G4L3_9CRUS|nr:Uncharacterized protein APZ42_006017 [Daphnia magna]
MRHNTRIATSRPLSLMAPFVVFHFHFVVYAKMLIEMRLHFSPWQCRRKKKMAGKDNITISNTFSHDLALPAEPAQPAEPAHLVEPRRGLFQIGKARDN